MLQTFTYSTGLALTGRSAACAPATATRPAAEPRRRLFTIFILNLQLNCPWEGSVRVRLHPGRSPLIPVTTRSLPAFDGRFAVAYKQETQRGDPGMPPSVAVKQITERPPTSNQEQRSAQRPKHGFQTGVAQKSLFGRAARAGWWRLRDSKFTLSSKQLKREPADAGAAGQKSGRPGQDEHGARGLARANPRRHMKWPNPLPNGTLEPPARGLPLPRRPRPPRYDGSTAR